MLLRFISLIFLCCLVCGSTIAATGPASSDAAKMLAEGSRLIDAGRFSEAMALFEQVRRDYPGDEAAALAQVNCARTLISWSRFDQAEKMLSGVVESNQGKLVACWAQYWLGKSLVIQGKNEESIREMLKVRAMLPDRTDIEPFTRSRYTVGRLANLYAAKHKDLSDVVAYLGLDPTSPEARAETLAILAGYPGKNGRIDLANPALQRLIKEYPDAREDILWAKTEVAIGYLSANSCKGDFAKMSADMLESVYETGNEKDDEAALAGIWLAKYYDSNGKPDDAVTVLRKASDKYVGTAHADELLYNLGSLLCQQKQNAEAETVFNKLIAEMPESAHVSTAQYLLEQLKNYDDTTKPAASESMADIIKKCIAEYDGKQRDLAFSPTDAAVDDPYVVAAQAVALAHEDLPEQAFQLLDKYYEAHRDPEAEAAKAAEVARSIVDKNPNTILACWAQTILGRILTSSGRMDEGVAALLKVRGMLMNRLDLGPLRASRMILGEIIWNRIKDSGDYRVTKQTLGLDDVAPNDVMEARLALVFYLGGIGNFDLAVTALNQFAVGYPDKRQELEFASAEVAAGYVAQSGFSGEQAAAAVEMLRKTADADYVDDDIKAKSCYWLGKYYASQDRTDEAVSVLSKGKDSCLESVYGGYVAYELGELLAGEDRLIEAKAVMRQLASAKPRTSLADAAIRFGSGKLLDARPVIVDSVATEDVADVILNERTGVNRNIEQLVHLLQTRGLGVSVDGANEICDALCRQSRDLMSAKSEIALCSIAAALDAGNGLKEGIYVLGVAINEAKRAAVDSSTMKVYVDGAFGLAEKAVHEDKRDPLLGHWMNELACLYVILEDYDAATKAFAVVSQLDAPDDVIARALYFAGMCHSKMGHVDIARRCMSRVVEYHSHSAWARRAIRVLDAWSTGGRVAGS